MINFILVYAGVRCYIVVRYLTCTCNTYCANYCIFRLYITDRTISRNVFYREGLTLGDRNPRHFFCFGDHNFVGGNSGNL